MLLNSIQLEIEKIWRKNRNDFRKSCFPTAQILTIIEGVIAQNLEAIQLFVDFSKGFDSTPRGKMEQKLFAYDLLKKLIPQ